MINKTLITLSVALKWGNSEFDFYKGLFRRISVYLNWWYNRP